MKTLINFKDVLFYIPNFLSTEHYKELHKDIITSRKKLNFYEPHYWVKKLTNNYKLPLKLDVTKEYFKSYEKNIKELNIIPQESVLTFMIYMMGKESGMNWHDDGNHSFGITYYLNYKWNENWGGEFMFKYNGLNRFLEIKGNSLLIIKSPIKHKINPVLTSIVPRITLQSFC